MKVTILAMLAGALLLSADIVPAEEIRVAVASNFSHAARDIAKRFEVMTGHRVTLISGATGKHYVQIRNGAPFDVFLAADARRPKLLEQEAVAVPGSRFTFAVGKIVLWSPASGLIDTEGKVLGEGDFRYLAMANPKLAPYGKAAEQVLRQTGLWEQLRGRMVRGENIGQTFQFVRSGNAELGFVAYSQIKSPQSILEGSYWVVPQALYETIEQQAVLLNDTKAARDFLAFVRSDDGREIIQGYGYGAP